LPVIGHTFESMYGDRRGITRGRTALHPMARASPDWHRTADLALRQAARLALQGREVSIIAHICASL
jgi:hypothetical protein